MLAAKLAISDDICKTSVAFALVFGGHGAYYGFLFVSLHKIKNELKLKQRNNND